MKIKQFGIVALVAIIGFSFAACSNDGGTTDTGPYTVSYKSNGGNEVPSETVNSGGTATRPKDPTRSGFTFDNWYSNPGLTKVYVFSTPVTGDITLYARWNRAGPTGHTVSFNSNGGSAVPSETVASGGTATRPEDPTRSGYTFDDWYSNPGLTTVYDFATPVTKDITLYAKWNPAGSYTDSHTVTFNSNGGSTVPSETVDSGGTATRPEDPTRSGYTFDDWYDADLTTAYVFSTPVTDDITLHAKWNPTSPTGPYTVSYNSNGGSTVPSETVDLGDTATRPEDPTRSGYIFDDWYDDADLTTAYDFSTPVTGDITLHAKWNPAYTVIFNSNGGSEVPSQPIIKDSGDTATRPEEDPTRNGYTFDDWYSDEGLSTVYDFATPVTGDITLHAKWRVIEMVWIKDGTFKIGSPVGETGRNSQGETQHDVTLTKGFYIGKYPVTQAEYEAVTGSNPSYFKTSYSPETSTANRPVEQVSWYDAIVFCNKLSKAEILTPAYEMQTEADTTVWSTDTATWGTVPTSFDARWNAVRIVTGSTGYRLPTEAQWEYACRAGTTTAYHTGATISTNTGWYSSNSGSRTHSVGEKSANAWGLYDMHGNVSEWCWDWYNPTYYSSSSAQDPMGPAAPSNLNFRSARGGTYYSAATNLRSAFRDGNVPYDRTDDFGFRLVRPAQ